MNIVIGTLYAIRGYIPSALPQNTRLKQKYSMLNERRVSDPILRTYGAEQTATKSNSKYPLVAVTSWGILSDMRAANGTRRETCVGRQGSFSFYDPPPPPPPRMSIFFSPFSAPTHLCRTLDNIPPQPLAVMVLVRDGGTMEVGTDCTGFYCY